MLSREVLDSAMVAGRENFSVFACILFVIFVLPFKTKSHCCPCKYKLEETCLQSDYLTDMPVRASLTATDSNSSQLCTFSGESLLQTFKKDFCGSFDSENI